MTTKTTRVNQNWERLVKGTLRLTGVTHERSGSPDSLNQTITLEAVLQAADDIQSKDPHVARILCEQAYSMAQNLDPDSEGTGVLQFKTGVMCVIKQKLAKKDGGRIDRDRDAQHLWKFYQQYKRKHKVDEEELKMLESGTFSADMGLRSQVFTTLRALVEVLKGFIRVGIEIAEEIRGAISAVAYKKQFPKFPRDFEVPAHRVLDMFDLLEFVVGFQSIDDRAVTEVFLKVLEDYIKWCKNLRKPVVWNSMQAINKDRKLFLVSLYFLIWGEAANGRFLPECIYYIFHHMARELDATLDSGKASPAVSCVGEDKSVSFQAQVIQPIYDMLSKEAARNNNGKAAHSDYDDFNENFWSPACFEFSWPMKKKSLFLRWPKKKKGVTALHTRRLPVVLGV